PGRLVGRRRRLRLGGGEAPGARPEPRVRPEQGGDARPRHPGRARRLLPDRRRAQLLERDPQSPAPPATGSGEQSSPSRSVTRTGPSKGPAPPATGSGEQSSPSPTRLNGRASLSRPAPALSPAARGPCRAGTEPTPSVPRPSSAPPARRRAR